MDGDIIFIPLFDEEDISTKKARLEEIILVLLTLPSMEQELK